MSTTLNLESLGLLFAFLVPGLVSMQVYRLLMPAKQVGWSEATLQAFFYSAVNFSLLYFAPYLYRTNHLSGFWASWVFIVLYVLVGPALWPWLLVKAFRSKRVARRLKIPFPST